MINSDLTNGWTPMEDSSCRLKIKALGIHVLYAYTQFQQSRWGTFRDICFCLHPVFCSSIPSLSPLEKLSLSKYIQDST